MKDKQVKIKSNDVVINIEDDSDIDSSLVPASSSSGINNYTTTTISSTETVPSEWAFCRIKYNQGSNVDQNFAQLNVNNLENNYWVQNHSNELEITIVDETTATNNLASGNGDSLAINMSDIENQQQCSISSICSIIWANANNQLNLENINSGILFPTSRSENLPGINDSNIQLVSYNQCSEDCIISMPHDFVNDDDIAQHSFCSQFFVKNWVPILIKAGTHLAATSILTTAEFWSPWGLIPRMVGLIFGTGITKLYDEYIKSKRDQWSTKELACAQMLKVVLDAVVIAGTVGETAVFNFHKLDPSEQTEFWNAFNGIFINKIFFNYISQKFSIEQIIGIVHNVFSFINIFTKYDNKLTQGWDKLQQLSRSSIIIVAFGMLFGQVFNNEIETKTIKEKLIVLIGIQVACTGAYIWLWNVLKDSYRWLKSLRNPNNNE